MGPLITAADMAEFRAMAESMMVDTCIVTRADPDAVKGGMDPDTMQYPDVDRITVYAGRCRIQINSVTAGAKDVTAGDREGTTQTPELQVPVDGTETISVNDVVTITAAANDDSLVGRQYTVSGRHEKTHATARRLPLTEGTS